MKLTASVARTAHDLTHVNRLRVPAFGVRGIALAIGGKTSKIFLQEGAPPLKEEDKGVDDLHFAPEKEKPKITYRIDDPCGRVTKATLELFRRDEAAAVWKKELVESEFSHNEGEEKHEIEWDGKIDKSTEFPEEYITVQHSPYKLKVTLEGEGFGFCKVAWTYFHVLVHDIELELGPKDVVKQARDKTLWDAVKGTGTLKEAIPADGVTKEINLISNLFSTGSDKGDNTAFKEYRTTWGAEPADVLKDGPNIPIIARVLVKTSDDKGEDVPKAVGKVKLLWDWEDIAEDVSMHFTEGKEFIESSLDRYKDTTRPKGDNCHKDHGGKRGDDTRFVFPEQAGYEPADALTADTFPFKVEKCTTRKWSSYSHSWATGILKGQSGVMFQPARMAGDVYKVTVYFPHNRKPDGKDDLDMVDDALLKHAVKKTTGTFQIWREVHLIKYLKKVSTIPSITMATVQAYYDKAYMRMVDKTGGIIDMTNYDTNFRAKSDLQTWHRKLAVMAGDQGTITKSAAKYLSYTDWKDAVKTHKGWNTASLNSWLTTNNLETVGKYKTFLEAVTDAVVPKACDTYLSATDGINILQFDLYWEADGGLKSGTNGFAATSFPSSSRSKAAYIQSRADYTGMGLNSMQQTTTHEIGHILFLPHAHDAGGFVEALHDDKAHWNNCTMSYNYDKERKFCGLCLLRMRGWDQTNLDSDRTKNKKP